MTPWHDGRLVAFDLESTGVDLEEARIVTAAIASCGGGLETQTLTLLADPGVEIPEEASAVHGITTERARAEGEPANRAIATIRNTLAGYTAGGMPIVAFNARFDLTILDRECRRHGIKPLDVRRVVDPFVIDKHLHRYRKGSRKLEAQALHYTGAPFDLAHDAAFDAVCAARVAWCIGKRGEIVRRVRGKDEAIEKNALVAEWERVRHDIDLLHAAQVRWAAAQAASLEDYFRSQGKDERVERAWPVVPVPVAA
jgi:DNA polymerase III subunit epsilon